MFYARKYLTSDFGCLPALLSHYAQNPTTSPTPRRLPLLPPDAEINEYLNQNHALGNFNPAFTMTGIWSGGIGRGRNLQAGDPYEIDLIEATPSVDSNTLVIVNGPITAGDNFFTADGNALEIAEGETLTLTADQFAVEETRLLVTAPLDTHTGSGYTGEFAILTVNNVTGAVDGMVKKSGEDLVKVAKTPGLDATVSNQDPFAIPADWACGFDGVISVDPVSLNEFR